jgi:hypothetical protein
MSWLRAELSTSDQNCIMQSTRKLTAARGECLWQKKHRIQASHFK